MPILAHIPGSTLPPEIIAVTWLMVFGTALLAGSILFLLLVARPGSISRRIDTYIKQLWLGWLLMGIAGAAGLLVRSDIAGMQPDNLLSDLEYHLNSSLHYGVVWLTSMALWVLLGLNVLLYQREIRVLSKAEDVPPHHIIDQGPLFAILALASSVTFTTTMYNHPLSGQDSALTWFAEGLYYLIMAAWIGTAVQFVLQPWLWRIRQPTLWAYLANYLTMLAAVMIVSRLLLNLTDVPSLTSLWETYAGQIALFQISLFSPYLLMCIAAVTLLYRRLAAKKRPVFTSRLTGLLAAEVVLLSGAFWGSTLIRSNQNATSGFDLPSSTITVWLALLLLGTGTYGLVSQRKTQNRYAVIWKSALIVVGFSLLTFTGINP